MLKKFLPWIATLLCFSSLPAQETTIEHPVNTAENQTIAQFEKQMQNQLQEAEKKVEQMEKALSSDDVVHTYEMVIQYKNAVRMLDIKKTLVNNFTGTGALGSPVVRENILNLLQKDTIKSGDLANLQNVVNSEKVR